MEKKMKKMSKWKYTAVLALCGVALVGCKQAPTGQRQAEYAGLTITTGDYTLTDTYSATIRGRQDIDIYPQVSGTIAELRVKEGETVRKGQTLFIIDQVPYKAALRTAEANVKAAEAAVATAQLTYDSKKQLFAKDVISEFDLSTAHNNLLSAQAQLAQTEAQQLIALNNLSYTVVKAPSDGMVGTLPYRVGALVSASLPQPLTTVSDNSQMYVYFSLTENQLLNLTREYGSIDNTLKNMPAVQLRLNDGTIYSQPGRVESISGVIDPSTGSVQLRAVFPNSDRLLHSGGVGNVLIPRELKNQIIVPQSATFETQDKVFVYKIVDGVAKSAMIDVLSSSNGREYVVTSGLTPGETILAEGVGLMREGTPVKIKGAQPAPAQPAAAADTTQTEKEE